MVDAINGVPGIKPKDLSIDWNDCTANEVMEYKDEGQEVPEAVLAWAEDMAKNQAGADEITYEMSLNNPDQMSATSAGNTDIGANLRAEMEQNGVSISDQAQTLGDESNDQSNSVTTLESEMETILAQSEETAANVEEYSNNLLTQIQALMARQESMQNDTSSPFAALDSLQIENQIRELANLGVANIETDSQSVYSATNGIDTALSTSDSAVSIGTQAINVGNELFRFSNNTMDTIASYAVSSGNNAISNAQSGRTIFNDTASQNTANEDRVDEAQGNVSREAGALGTLTVRPEEQQTQQDVTQDATDNAQRDNKPVDEARQEATDKFEQDRQNNQEQAEIDPTLADTSITTDPNEILKRKERKGLT